MAIGLCIAVGATGFDMGRRGMAPVAPVLDVGSADMTSVDPTPALTGDHLAGTHLTSDHAASGGFASLTPAPMPTRDDPFWRATEVRQPSADPFTPDPLPPVDPSR